MTGPSALTGPGTHCAGPGAQLFLPAVMVPTCRRWPYLPSALAEASIAASDRRTWLRSVVYQKSGSEARR